MEDDEAPPGPCCFVKLLRIIFIAIIILIIPLILYFTVFRSKHPKISFEDVRLTSFSNTNNSLNFKFYESFTVNNPNSFGKFSYGEGSMILMYYSNQLGLQNIPAGEIAGGKTKSVAAEFMVQNLPLPAELAAGGGGTGWMRGIGGGMIPNITGDVRGAGDVTQPYIEMLTMVNTAGKMKNLFTHSMGVKEKCSVLLGVMDGSILGAHC